MKTLVLKINPRKIDSKKIDLAAEEIKKGHLVAFPTETVYGLGADAYNEGAIKKIFQVKGRPYYDPLIVHIAKPDELQKLAREIPPIAWVLAETYWPGPLTLVVKKSNSISSLVTAGLDTVAVRMPANRIALSLIQKAQTPLVAPSANLFGRTSPTQVQHVLEDLDGKVEVIIDGGETRIGVESTVLDITVEPVQILRAGGISLEKLRKVINQVALNQELESGFRSPGRLKSHYSPRAKLILVEKRGEEEIKEVSNLASHYTKLGYKVGIMAKEENKERYKDFNIKILGKGNRPASCATNLFKTLRNFDQEGFEIIIAEGLEEKGLGLAIMERLRKASADKIS
ncbi:MAG: L-threonylcarbamoyladenylate synthase [Candidatus Caldatribacteriota bacterium]